jgi:hypothetical protein
MEPIVGKIVLGRDGWGEITRVTEGVCFSVSYAGGVYHGGIAWADRAQYTDLEMIQRKADEQKFCYSVRGLIRKANIDQFPEWEMMDSPDTRRKEPIVLGNVVRGNFLSIANEIKQDSNLSVVFDDCSGSTFPPSWVFDYPEEIYLNRDKALAEVNELFSDPKNWSLVNLPSVEKAELMGALLAARVDNKDYLEFLISLGKSEAQKAFIKVVYGRLLRLKKLSLSVIYLTVVEHFVRVLKCDKGWSFIRSDFDLLFFNDQVERPLFVYDPLRTVVILISTLSRLWNNRNERLKTMGAFHLRGLNLLDGIAADNKRYSVLAYCGGCIADARGGKSCGVTPLIYGNCENCDACGNLICEACWHCSQSCCQGKLRRQNKSLLSEIREMNRLAESDPLPECTSVSPLIPDKSDEELVKKWVEQENGEGRIRQMLSARIAEKGVASFFKMLKKSVVDVSIQQIEQPNGGDWEKYDLKIEELCIDVKNSRQSERNPDRYTSHCVPKFKETRSGSVYVAAVLSPWLTEQEIRTGKYIDRGSGFWQESYWSRSQESKLGDEYTLKFLGLTTERKIRSLANEIKNGSDLSIVFDDFSGPKFLPPWVFDYPEELYPNRNRALAEVNKLVSNPKNWSLVNLPFAEKAELMSALLAARVENKDYLEFLISLGTSEAQKAFIEMVYGRLLKLKSLSLPVIYLTVLEHFVRMLKYDKGWSFISSDFDLLFPNNQIERPLFVYDPLRTVETLISTLSRLWHNKNESLKTMGAFHLRGLNLLDGIAANNKRYSVLAYCGGWITDDRGARPCGTTPLVYGNCDNCDTCGNLICRNCSYCSQACEIHAKNLSRTLTV